MQGTSSQPASPNGSPTAPAGMSEAERLTQALLMAAQNTANAIASLQQQQQAFAATQAASQASSSGGGSNKFAEAAQVVRIPDPFDAKTVEEERNQWPDFLLNFKAWLYYANNAYETDLTDVEAHLDTPIDLLNVTMEKELRAKQLYSIFTGLLRGRALRLLRQVDDRNGLEAYRQLCKLYAPHTKSRTMALLQQLCHCLLLQRTNLC